jgi:hypothetical protein
VADLEAVQCPILHADGHDTHAVPGVVHDEVGRKVLNEELRPEAEGATIERVKHGVASAVSGAGAAVSLASLPII